MISGSVFDVIISTLLSAGPGWHTWNNLEKAAWRRQNIDDDSGVYFLKLGDPLFQKGRCIYPALGLAGISNQNVRPFLDNKLKYLNGMKADCSLLYIGKTTSEEGLGQRLGAFFNSSVKFTNFFHSGGGVNMPKTSHDGGKYIWALYDSVARKPIFINAKSPTNVEFTWITCGSLKSVIQKASIKSAIQEKKSMGPLSIAVSNSLLNDCANGENWLIMAASCSIGPSHFVFPFGNNSIQMPK